MVACALQLFDGALIENASVRSDSPTLVNIEARPSYESCTPGTACDKTDAPPDDETLTARIDAPEPRGVTPPSYYRVAVFSIHRRLNVCA